MPSRRGCVLLSGSGRSHERLGGRPPDVADTPRRPSPGLSAVRPASRQHAPRAPFVITVLLLLLGGLGGLLLLNTLLAQGSFTVQDLDLRVAALKDTEQALQQKVATLAAPARLAKRAGGLGMVPAPNPAFIRMSDGRILGDPEVAPQPYTAPVSPPPVPAQQEQQDQQDQQRTAGTQQGEQNQSDQQQGERQQSEQQQGQQQPEHKRCRRVWS